MKPALAALAALAASVTACELPWSSDSDESANAPDAKDGTAESDACANAGDLPDDLACTGLYASWETKSLSPRARAYAPAVALWSDGFEKERWIDLPDGTTIDGSNVDDWRFPVGTKVWKEFRKGARKIETRFFHKVRDDRWVQTAYVWSPDGTRATRADGAEIDVDGAPYVVPNSSQCSDCHRGRRDRMLGFEALSLAQAGATGLTLEALVAEGRIEPAPPRTKYELPSAIGYLHINCGVTCHNGTPTATAFSTQLRLRVAVREVEAPPSSWDLFESTMGVLARTPRWEGQARISPGRPGQSLVLRVMKQRGEEGQMPPLATDLVDVEGASAVEEWIRSLPRRGVAKPKGDAGL